MIDGPRSIREEEYDDLMRLLERSYEKIREFFQNGLPHIWKRENVQIENRFIIKKDGKIVSHVGLMPLNLVVDNKVIKAGGIGGVATDPDFRKSGFMSELLKYTIAKIKDGRFPISVLWGDRQRYGSYGWEWTGVKLTTVLTKRNLEKLHLTKKVESKKYAGESDSLQKIIEIHNREPLYVKREKEVYKMLMSKPGLEVWLGEGNKGWAYVVISGEEREKTIIERGGEPEVFLPLISDILKKTNAENLRIVQSNRFTSLTNVISKVCGWHTIAPLTMLKIMNIDLTLKSFGVKTNGIKFQMTGVDENKFEQIEISGEEIKLPEQAMVRLLFGPLKPSNYFKIEPALAKVLDSSFPLNFFIWELDNI